VEFASAKSRSRVPDPFKFAAKLDVKLTRTTTRVTRRRVTSLPKSSWQNVADAKRNDSAPRTAPGRLPRVSIVAIGLVSRRSSTARHRSAYRRFRKTRAARDSRPRSKLDYFGPPDTMLHVNVHVSCNFPLDTCVMQQLRCRAGSYN